MICAKVDDINWEATNILDAVTDAYFLANFYEPPLTKDKSVEQLILAYQLWKDENKPIKESLGLPNIKSHSMANEKGVQQTTRAVARHVGHLRQKGAIIVTKDNVDQYPINSNKTVFKRNAVKRKLEYPH